MKYFILTLIMAMGLAVLAADVVFSYTLNEPELKTANGYSHLKLDGAQSWEPRAALTCLGMAPKSFSPLEKKLWISMWNSVPLKP